MNILMKKINFNKLVNVVNYWWNFIFKFIKIIKIFLLIQNKNFYYMEGKVEKKFYISNKFFLNFYFKMFINILKYLNLVKNKNIVIKVFIFFLGFIIIIFFKEFLIVFAEIINNEDDKNEKDIILENKEKLIDENVKINKEESSINKFLKSKEFDYLLYTIFFIGIILVGYWMIKAESNELYGTIEDFQKYIVINESTNKEIMITEREYKVIKNYVNEYNNIINTNDFLDKNFFMNDDINKKIIEDVFKRYIGYEDIERIVWDPNESRCQFWKDVIDSIENKKKV